MMVPPKEAEMIVILDSPDDTIAVKVSGKIIGGDLNRIMDRLDRIMASHDKVHVFVETESISGMELSAMADHMRRAFPLLGKLDRFGRVAVVADQAWIRAGTRLESALLPNVSYRTYMPDERDEALAWVTAEVPAPQPEKAI